MGLPLDRDIKRERMKAAGMRPTTSTAPRVSTTKESANPKERTRLPPRVFCPFRFFLFRLEFPSSFFFALILPRLTKRQSPYFGEIRNYFDGDVKVPSELVVCLRVCGRRSAGWAADQQLDSRDS